MTAPLSEEIKAQQKRIQNLTMEIQTIDVLAQHAIADLREAGETTAHRAEPRVNAALRILETIEVLVSSYR